VVEVSNYHYALPVGPLNQVITFTEESVHTLENREYIRDSNGVQLGPGGHSPDPAERHYCP
jgi:hypothetical protein